MIVLAIDDDSMILRAIARLFGKDTTHVAEAIEEGAVLADRLQPDVILVDASVRQENDGIEAISMLVRRSPSSAVIVLTGNSDTKLRRRSFALGARAYIDKMHITRLREIVEDIISSSVERRPLRDLLH